jgi:protein-disulfide isomerase
MRISVVSVVAATLALAACGNEKTAAPAATGDALVAGPAVPPPAGTSWVEVTAATPEGGFRMGNPDAKVKLVEFASLTCPHCKDFHEAAAETIKNKYVASGQVSYEFRNFVLNGPDYAASLLARCQGPQAFFGLLGAFFSDQAGWTAPFGTLTPEQQKAISALPQDQQIAAIATAGQLDSYVRTRGIPKAKFDQCLSDPAAIKTIADLGTQATGKYKLTGTPGFIINEQTQEGVSDWATLEPKLVAALQ